MSFYIKPPRGFIDYNVLQKCAEERLKFYNNNTLVHGIQYLYEDSAFDRSGHFMLRLVALKYPYYFRQFIDSEVNLLNLRLSCYDGKLLHTFFKTQFRHATESQKEERLSSAMKEFLQTFTEVIQKMLNKAYRLHVFADEHIRSDACAVGILEVPFQHCHSLIVAHEFPLKNGFVEVYCDKWKRLLVSLFRTYLQIALCDMKHSENVQLALEDARIKNILRAIGTQSSLPHPEIVGLGQIEYDYKFFPLCMQNLYVVLKKTHRLAHEERFNMSLFLKDIGLSLEASVNFWRKEYSEEHSKCSSCSHSWYKDEKRYIYSIKHLYGLEGSRRVYRTRSCSYFQNMSLRPLQHGGCPFKFFDNDKLALLMQLHFSVKETDMKNIISQKKNPYEACKVFFNIAKCYWTNDRKSFNCNFKDPIQYFTQMKHDM